MHYYKFNIKDWSRDTSHLSVEEEGVYRRLLDHYYESELPIPTETKSVIRRLRLGGHEEATSVILGEFFSLEEDGYHHKRCDDEIEKYHSKAVANRENGKRGGRPVKPKENPDGSHGEPKQNLNQEPLTTNQEPIKKPSRSAKAVADESFDSFWKLYPKKVSKKDAIKAWSKIEPYKHPEIMQGLANHRVSQGWVRDDGQFIPNAATWLNAERWEDEVRPHVAGQPNAGAGSTGKPSLSEQVRQRNAERQAERDREAGQGSQGSAELFASGVDDYGRDFEGEFSRINDLDGKIVVADDRPVWP
jgi:uncharacterized protein YdaU (DUF1376 family)